MPGGANEFSATTVGARPYSDVNSNPSASDDFWYVFTPTADGAIGFRAALTAGSGYAPRLRPWYGTPGSLVQYMEGAIITTNGAPMALPTFAGVAIYLQIDSTGGTPSGAQITFTATAAPVGGSVARGSVFIANELAFEQPAGQRTFEPLPGALLSAADGEVLRLVPGFPACEAGDVLPTGEILVDDSYDLTVLHLFHPDFALIADVTPPITPRTASSVHRVAGTTRIHSS